MTSTLNLPEVRRRKRGFTLVEIMIVVTIIGLLAVLAVPIWNRARQNSLTNAFMNDLRIGTQAAQRCMMENGTWPAEVAAGVQPPLLAGYMADKFWAKPSPLGGTWDWDYEQGGFRAGLALDQPVVDPATMNLVDSKFDDGNLSTGSFRADGANRYVFVLEF